MAGWPYRLIPQHTESHSLLVTSLKSAFRKGEELRAAQQQQQHIHSVRVYRSTSGIANTHESTLFAKLKLTTFLTLCKNRMRRRITTSAAESCALCTHTWMSEHKSLQQATHEIKSKVEELYPLRRCRYEAVLQYVVTTNANAAIYALTAACYALLRTSHVHCWWSFSSAISTDDNDKQIPELTHTHKIWIHSLQQ